MAECASPLALTAASLPPALKRALAGAVVSAGPQSPQSAAGVGACAAEPLGKAADAAASPPVPGG